MSTQSQSDNDLVSSDLAGAADSPLFTSLATTVIDELRFPSGQVIENVLGGSATYSILGARLFCTGQEARSLVWVAHAGFDFPREAERVMDMWQVDLTLVKSSLHPSTKAVVTFHDATLADKTFTRLTPVRCPTVQDLAGTRAVLSKYIHCMCTPSELVSNVDKLLRLRLEAGLRRPKVIWEPLPASCTWGLLPECIAAMKEVDVFSPNHLELLSLFDLPRNKFLRSTIENIAHRCLQNGVGQKGNGVVVVRCGELGCMLASRNGEFVWKAPYHREEVVDTTGAGNAFLGGLVKGHHERSDWAEALDYGAVAASFTIEQYGPPKLQRQGEDEERWNGESPRARLGKFRSMSGQTSRAMACLNE